MIKLVIIEVNRNVAKNKLRTFVSTRYGHKQFLYEGSVIIMANSVAFKVGISSSGSVTY